ncbi:MAG: SDR family NAD(P)-dependent oxidoreductase [Spartobacteria bacterium]|nr:SDR family NAD(P)-dependent oxidoreductase [Spartobacteria bacterium]
MPEQIKREPVALVGMGCYLPGGARGPAAFWKLLCDEVDTITPIPESRWNIERFQDDMRVRGGAFLDDIEGFDAAFFGISPREASVMDPMQRILLEVAWEALEDAGVLPERLAGESVCVYAGAFALDYKLLQLNSTEDDHIGIHTSTGIAATLVANRISHWFDLRGASVTLDTACSSSMTALHLACRDIWDGRSRMALAAGVNVICYPEWTLAADRGGFLSPDGRSKAFSERADGYGRGEGAGVLVLKPLSQAIADNDRVYALIRGTAINQDGHTDGITVPRAEAQESVMRAACADAGIAPQDVRYVEAHGTGTPVGDPIEVAAIGRVYGRPALKEPCCIGSVKTNIAHLEAAAGVAGVIKAALSLYHRKIPATLRFGALNGAIDFDGLGLRVVERLEDFPETDHGAFAGVNSFGFGGANGHAVLQRAEFDAERKGVAPSSLLLPVSAKTPEALMAMVARYSACFDAEDDPDFSLTDLCYSAAVRRQHLAVRAVFVANDKDGFRRQLHSFDGTALPKRDVQGKTAFVFSGMGTQWVGMADECFSQEGVLADVARRYDACFMDLSGWSLLEAMRDEARIHDTAVAQPAIVLVQVLLHELWRARGVLPDMITGHSLGELTAAYAAGGLTLEGLVTLVFHRSRLQALLEGRGGMLAAALPVTELSPFLDGLKGVEVAAVNSPCSVTLAGPVDALKKLSDRLAGRQQFNRLLKVSVPYHTGIMDGIKADFLEAIRDVNYAPVQVPLYSSQTGRLVSLHDAEYWYSNLRNKVHFEQAVCAMQRAGAATFLEMGPHAVLLQSIRECCGAKAVAAIPSLLRGANAGESITAATAELCRRNVNIDWSGVYSTGRLVSLPLYAWQHRPYWNESAVSRNRRIAKGVCSDASGASSGLVPGGSAAQEQEEVVRLDRMSYLAGHRIDDAVVFPATGYLDLCFQRAERQNNAVPCRLNHVRLHKALFLEGPSELQMVSGAGTFEIKSRSNSSPEWQVNVTGETAALSDREPRSVSRAEILARCPAHHAGSFFYETLRRVGYDYEGAFCSVEDVWVGPREAVSRIPNVDRHASSHPAIVDGALQTLLAALLSREGPDGLAHLYLPVEMESVCLHREVKTAVYAHAVLREVSAQHIVGDVALYDEAGSVLVRLEGVACKGMPGLMALPGASGDVMYRLVWEEQPLPKDAGDANGVWLIYREAPGCTPVMQGLRENGGTVEVVEGAAAVDAACHAPGVVRDDLRGVIFSGTAAELLNLVHRLVAGNLSLPLIILTCGVVSGKGYSRSPLWGLGRVAANEHPDLEVRLIDLNCDPEDTHGEKDMFPLLLEELCQQQAEGEVYLSEGKRHVCRILPYASRPLDDTASSLLTCEDPYRLVCDESGRSADVVAVSTQREDPRAGEVEIQVCASGINFKDVLKARGLLDPSNLQGYYRGLSLGLECAGRITAVGDDVKGYRVGDEVFGFASGAFGSYVVARAELILPKPQTWSFEEAASFPIAYMTAWYGLNELAHLRPGETVLIHVAAGGVGQAAVHLARMLGAEIIATAGSDPKRRFLRQQGIEHVFDSRRDSFVEDILAVTGGKGVDVVLNSLSGELLEAGLRALSPFGRFVEIGKRDIDANGVIHLQPFRKNISFFAVDLDALLFERADFGRQMLEAMTKRVCERDEPFPLPIRAYSISKFLEAFQCMADARQIGKLVLSVEGETVGARPLSCETLSRDAAYLITGGLSGLGLATAVDMARRGAQHLILVSRSGKPRSDANAAIQQLRDMGVTVQMETTDIGNEQQVAALFTRLSENGAASLKGIIHSATVYDDGYISQLTDERLQRVLHPKAQGAWLLHKYSRSLPLDFFVMYSSISSTIGNPGQANYAAANSWLESLAAFRHEQGLPALTVNWGAIQGAGYVEQHDNVAQHLDRAGIHALPLSRVFETLWRLLRDNATQAVVADVNWHTVQQRSSPRTAKKFDYLAREEGESPVRTKGNSSLTVLLEGIEATQRAAWVEQYLRNILAGILGYAEGQDIDAFSGFFDLGVDSMMAMEFNARLEEELNRSLPATLVFRYPTLQALSEFVLREIAPSSPAADPDELSQDDVRSLLEQELLAETVPSVSLPHHEV